jgi:hypothetical protein
MNLLVQAVVVGYIYVTLQAVKVLHIYHVSGCGGVTYM